jgi:hypothetical protein
MWIPTRCCAQKQTPGWDRALKSSIEMIQPMCVSSAF